MEPDGGFYFRYNDVDINVSNINKISFYPNSIQVMLKTGGSVTVFKQKQHTTADFLEKGKLKLLRKWDEYQEYASGRAVTDRLTEIDELKQQLSQLPKSVWHADGMMTDIAVLTKKVDKLENLADEVRVLAQKMELLSQKMEWIFAHVATIAERASKPNQEG